MSIRSYRVSTRIGAGFAALVLLLLAVGAGSLWQMGHMDEKSEEVQSNWLPSIIALEDVGMSAMQMRNATLRAYIDYNPQTRQRVMDERNTLAGKEETYRPLISSSEEKASYERFAAARQAYQDTQTKIFEMLDAGQKDQALQLVNGVLNQHGGKMTEALQALVQINKQGRVPPPMPAARLTTRPNSWCW